MHTIDFYKYQGTGNDFVIIDDRSERFNIENEKLIARLCNRKFGIGADGLILIRNHQQADFEMIYFNSDGHLTSLCGNGSRCAVQFASQLKIIGDQCSFMTVEGVLEAKIVKELVHVKMPNVVDIEVYKNHYFLQTGSPHHVCFVKDIEDYNVFNQGRAIRNGPPYFTEGANVNFVELVSNNQIYVRTYERGVENETLSCGTGVTAAAIVQGLKGVKSPIKVNTLGGELQISFEKGNKDNFSNIFLIGPAELVFSGSVSLGV